MSQTTATAHKTIGRGFSNEMQMVKLTYDATVDSKLAADTVKLGTTNGKICVHMSRVVVETAFTSGGSATVIMGVNGGDTDAFLDATSGAVASLADDSVHQETTGQGIVLASGAVIEMDVATADLTAGKAHLYLWYTNHD